MRTHVAVVHLALVLPSAKARELVEVLLDLGEQAVAFFRKQLDAVQERAVELRHGHGRWKAWAFQLLGTRRFGAARLRGGGAARYRHGLLQ